MGERCQLLGEGAPQQATCRGPLALGQTGMGGSAQERAGGEAKPQVLCPPSPSDATRPPLPGFLNCALNTKPHGAGLCTACVALRGLQKDYLRKKWAQFVLTPRLVSDCHQQPKAENPALPVSWQPATQAARPVPPTPFDLPLSKAFKCSKPRPCLQEPGG